MRIGSLVLALVACGGENPARTAIDAQKEAAPATSGWTCPMHPDVHAGVAGPCPVCGMPLVQAGS